MKAVILAGGYGTRISEESTVRPKPMVEIGGMPILWHIMKIYANFGINDFVICCGYKGHMIKEWFLSYRYRNADVTFDFNTGDVDIHNSGSEDWRVTLVDTGEATMTGGRIKRAAPYIGESTFCLTYGDGVGDIDIGKTIALHRNQRTAVTMTAVQPEGRFGIFPLDRDETLVRSFKEKPKGESAWANAGFFIVEPAAIDYIVDDSTIWEQEPLQELAVAGEISAYRHTGFWMPMDTLRDKKMLQDLWVQGNAPWKIW